MKIIKNINKVRRLSIVLVLTVTLFTSCSKDDSDVNEISEFVLIPDANFEQALIDLGYDTNGLNGNILRTEAEAVTSLDLSNKNISSLVGIEGFINLIELYCDENNLSTIDASQNKLLIEMSCYDNQLTDLDISNSTVLDYLYCSGNDLTSLDLSNNTLLKNLFCSNNNLTSLDLSNNSLLETFRGEYNQLSAIDLSNNSNLRSLRVSNNNLTAIDVSQNPILGAVRFNNNQLISLNIKNGFNQNIQSFTAHNNPNLTCIEVDDVAHSIVDWIDIDTQTSFSEDCAAFTATIAIPDVNFEQALIDLGYDTNGVTGDILQREAEAVTVLDVNEKNISSLQGIESFINLATLDCYNNLLTSLDLSNNTTLEIIRCNENQLETLLINNNPALVFINTRNNNLTDLDLSSCLDLETLNIFNNNISSIDVSNHPNFKFFLGDDNNLTNLSVKNGNNTNITLLSTINNSNLTCIEVDNAAFSTANWTSIDVQTSFSVDCN